jgi:transposase
MRRYELSERKWSRIAPLMPHRAHHGEAGHPFNDPRPIVNGILWVLHTGAPWRDLPERYGPWETVFNWTLALMPLLKVPQSGHSRVARAIEATRHPSLIRR